jgi:bestrophin-3
MTVSYQSDVASSTSGGLFRLLWRWRGSVWKLVYTELFFFMAAYLGLALSYDFLFTDFQRR